MRATTLLLCLLLPACSDWWDRLSPPPKRPEPAAEAKKAPEPPAAAQPEVERPGPSPDVVEGIRDLAGAMEEALAACTSALSGATRAGQGEATPTQDQRKACNLLAKVPVQRLRKGIALTGELDRALVSFAGLHPDVLELASSFPAQPRSGGGEEASAERAEEVAAVSRRLDELTREVKRLGAEAEKAQPAAADLHVLAVDTRSFVDTAAALVRTEVVDPVWRGLLDDVRRRVIRGRPTALEHNDLCIAAARAALARVSSAVDHEGEQRPQLKAGFSPFRVSVSSFVDRMDALRATLPNQRTSAQRLQVLSELRYIANRYRSAIDDDHRLWHEAAVAADRRLREAQERRDQLLRKAEGRESRRDKPSPPRSPQTPRRGQ